MRRAWETDIPDIEGLCFYYFGVFFISALIENNFLFFNIFTGMANLYLSHHVHFITAPSSGEVLFQVSFIVRSRLLPCIYLLSDRETFAASFVYFLSYPLSDRETSAPDWATTKKNGTGVCWYSPRDSRGQLENAHHVWHYWCLLILPYWQKIRKNRRKIKQMIF